MRKVIESTLVSLDGVIGDPQVWANESFDEEAVATALEQLRLSDAMLMGRNTYEMFAAAWPASMGDYADRMNEITKYVFSGTLEEATWRRPGSGSSARRRGPTASSSSPTSPSAEWGR
jgi:dihydrofolate reductase